MMKLVRLFGVLFSMSVRRHLAFRADLAFEIGFTVLTLVSSLIALSMVYTRTDTLGGWRLGEAIALLGTFQIISGLRAAFVEPNLPRVRDQVRNGTFDQVLIQPAPALFLASLGTAAPLALAQVGLGAAVVGYGIHHAGATPSALSVAAWLALLVIATAVMWATRVLFSSVAFWALGLSFDIVYDALWQFARYPVDLYPRALQLVFIYVFPIAFVATVPADVLLRGGGLAVIPVALTVATAACAAAILVWLRGLRRYTSATS